MINYKCCVEYSFAYLRNRYETKLQLWVLFARFITVEDEYMGAVIVQLYINICYALC